MKKFLFALCIISASHIFAQEHTTNLEYNSALLYQRTQNTLRLSDIDTTRDTLCLPFFDDFSNLNTFLDSVSSNCGDTIFNSYPSTVYPNNLFWLDSNVYINRSYPILPHTYGVATFDGLNKNGLPYNETITYGYADVLTSKPIYLGGTLTDTVYLSFYYQPGGFGNFPDENDSLVLEFRSVDSTWQKVWFALNTAGDVNQPFKIAMVPVIDAQYLYDGFQFRFHNWASVNGNNDQWNIDYVYMDENRSFDDTLFRDVSFVSDPTTILKTYRQMPWNQFKDFQETELATEHTIQIVNNFNDIVNTSYQYTAYEKYSSFEIVPPTLPISINFNPFSTQYISFPTFTIPNTTPGYNEDSMSVTMKYILDPSSDVKRINDTLYYNQAFYNYYAYDDGTAEKAYFLEGIGAKLAMRFRANKPDTLKEVYIHWAKVDGAHPGIFFSLIVWGNIDTTLASASENIIYEGDFLTPKFVDSLNGFYVYELTDFLGNPTPVVVDGYFYVGWLQSQADYLYAGFDENSNANANVFFNVGGNWQQSVIPGAIMIRPRVGGEYSIYTGLQNENKIKQLTIYPNPVQAELNIQNTFNGDAQFELFDYAGNKLRWGNMLNKTIDVSQLPGGFYILKVNDITSQQVYISKFVKQ